MLFPTQQWSWQIEGAEHMIKGVCLKASLSLSVALMSVDRFVPLYDPVLGIPLLEMQCCAMMVSRFKIDAFFVSCGQLAVANCPYLVR